MKTILIVGLIILSNLCFAQEQSRKEKRKAKNNNEVFNITINEDDKPKPEFDLPAYFQQSLIYPEQGQKAGIEGRVVVEFSVAKDGSISDVKVIKGKELGGGLPEEAVRVVSNMPRWKPAKLYGQMIRSVMTIPVDFKLTDKAAVDSIPSPGR